MICINKLDSNTLFQNLQDKYFDKCLTIGHFNESLRENIDYCDRDFIMDLRKGAECHKMVRCQLQNFIKPGKKIYDICNYIEKSICTNFGENSLKQGIGFPVGYSINNIIAHDTASPDDTRVLKKDDVVKIDFGTHVNGRIIDSAFTLAYDYKYEQLLNATKEATWAAIKMLGPETYVNDISEVIDEIISSHQIDLNGKIFDIKTVGNLGGHNIKPYVIHGGILILGKKSNNEIIKNMRLKEGECYALETFASTGTGEYNSIDNNHLFSLKKNHIRAPFKFDITNKVYNYIKNTHDTLPFCSRWLYDKFNNKYKAAMNELIKNNIVNTYPPLADIPNSYSSQLEHTVFIHDYGKEVVSCGEDY